MKFYRLVFLSCSCLTLFASLATADSLQLRNGRHLLGKYVGGTTNAIGFMSGASVEYFATSDVLALMFDGSNDSSLGGVQQPAPMTVPSVSSTYTVQEQSAKPGSRSVRKSNGIRTQNTGSNNVTACPSLNRCLI
jgi:hypothetical protein